MTDYPIWITPTLGTELLTNGDMETGDPPSDWTVGDMAVLAGDTDVRTGSTGAQSLKVTNGDDYDYARQAITAAKYSLILAEGWLKNGTANKSFLRISDTDNTTQYHLNELSGWVHCVVNRHILTTDGYIDIQCDATAGNTLYADDVSAKVVTLASTLGQSKSSNTSDFIAAASLVCVPGSWAGIAVSLNSITAPTKGIFAYTDGHYIYLDQLLAGVWSNLIKRPTNTNVILTYTDRGVLEVRKHGYEYSLYYRGSLVGSPVVITDTTIASSSLHALFSAYSGNIFYSWRVGDYATPALPPLPDISKGWNLVLSDDFQTFDDTVWTKTDSLFASLPTSHIHPANVTNITSGLHIEAHDHTTYVEGGQINSVGKFDFTYGYIESRIKVADTQGFISAFFLIGDAWPPEIDIFETLGKTPSIQYITIHDLTATNVLFVQNTIPYQQNVDLSAGYHTYGCLWEENYVVLYFDGQPIWYSEAYVPQSALSIWYILAVGAGSSTWPEPPDGTTVWPGTMDVEYVRVYQRSQPIGITTGEMLYKIANNLGELRYGAVADGGMTWLRDPGITEASSIYDTGTLFFLTGENAGRTAVIENWDVDTHIFTFPSARAPLRAGDQYAIMPARYSRAMLLGSLNMSLTELGPFQSTDETMTTVDDQEEYTLPLNDAATVQSIRIAASTTSPYNWGVPLHYWRQSGNVVYFDSDFKPYGGFPMQITYTGRHIAVSLDEDVITDQVHPERLAWLAAYHAAGQRARTQSNDSRLKEFIQLALGQVQILAQQYPVKRVEKDSHFSTY
jgi:hypothetical protein